MGYGGLVGLSGKAIVTGTGFGSSAGSMFAPDPNAQTPATQLDYLDAATAQAALTPGTADDLTAAQNAQSYYQGTYNQAVATGDPRIIGPAAQALKQAMDVVAGLKESIDAAALVQQQLTDATAQLAAEQKMIRTLAQTQGPQLLAGLAALLSGSVGGKVALGYQTPGFAGTMGGVRY
jgi:hypothetical protein